MTSPTTKVRVPVWRNLRVIRAVLQIVAIVAVVGGGVYLINNMFSEMRAQGLPTGFDFLQQPTGVGIPDREFSPNSPVWAALIAGAKNTFALVIVGVPLVTVVGTLIGIARLSTNWLVAKAASVYVETLRNVPPLLIIIFAFNALILRLPRPTNPATPLDAFVISNFKLVGPGIGTEEGSGVLWIITLAGLIAAAGVWIWRTRFSERTGALHHRVIWSLGVVVTFFVIGYIFTGAPVRLSRPEVDGRIITGGYGGLGSYFAVLIALTAYTASHVAEIVRGSILAVPKGQTEASNALALTAFQRLRYVVLPQAFRTALPPIINQYLNFTKNTSLAIAIGFSEVTVITFQAIGNGRPAPQLIAMLMLAYLSFTLTISLIANVINRQLLLVER